MKSAWVRPIGLLLLSAALILGLESAYAGTEVRRIASKVVDLGKVHKLYMVHGLATVIILPESISAVIPGNSVTLKIERKEPENLLALRLVGAHVPATNLIILSGKNRLVFDVIPNTKMHQDTLEVVGMYGAAGAESDDLKLIYSGNL